MMYTACTVPILFIQTFFALKQMFHGHESSLKLVCLVPGFKNLYLKDFLRCEWSERHHTGTMVVLLYVSVICCFRNIKSVSASNISQNCLRGSEWFNS